MTAETPETLRFEGDGGAVIFTMSADRGGVQIERTRKRSAADDPVTTVMRFRDEEGFTRWCDTDDLRHAYPLLFAQMRRSGLTLFRQR